MTSRDMGQYTVHTSVLTVLNIKTKVFGEAEPRKIFLKRYCNAT